MRLTKIDSRAAILSFSLALLLILIDLFLDYFLFNKEAKSIEELLFSLEELYMRGTIALTVLVFGLALGHAIARLKEANQELKETNSVKKALLEQTIPFGIQIVDEEGKILFCNHTMTLLYGNEVTGNICWTHKEDRTQCNYCPLKKNEVMEETLFIETSEFLRKRTFLISHTPLFYKGCKAFLEVFIDITDQKMLEEELRRKEAHLAEAQQIGHIGSWDWNIGANELYWTDEVHRIFGLHPKEFGATYETFLNSVHPDDRSFVMSSVNEALYQNAPYVIDHRILLPNGEVRVIHEKAKVFFDEKGKPVRMAGTAQDITERKHLEGELMETKLENERLEVLRTVAVTYAHNIFNSLTPLHGHAQLILKDTSERDPIHIHAQAIVEGSEKVVKIVRQIENLRQYKKRSFGGVDVLELEGDELEGLEENLKNG